jgi:hypothetical protein
MAEEDQRSILIIVEIIAFLPTSLAETRICVAGATSERKSTNTVIKEEKEKTSESSPIEEYEHIVKILTQWEEELDMLEDWLNNLEPEGGCKEIVMQIGEEC